MMRIALVVPGGLDRSGRERVIPILLWLIERLSRRHTVHAFVLWHYPEPCTYQLAGATVHDLGRATGPTGLRSILQLRHLIRALRLAGPFDVIHGYWGVPGGLPAGMAGRWLGTPTVVTYCSGEFVCVRQLGYGLQCSWRGRLTAALTARLATRVHVTSRYMERLATSAGLRVDVAPLGVDTGIFQPAAERPADGPPWRLLHVATLNRVKDQPTLLRALARVVARVAGVHLDVVGEDTLGGVIQNLCAGLQLVPHVTFHGFQATDRLPAFYQRAHLLVVTSRHEAAGIAILEAAASGLPTIGSAVGYIADWAPSAAYAVPAGDEIALADGIVALLGDPALRERLAREAQLRARAQDAEWTSRAMEHLYNASQARR